MSAVCPVHEQSFVNDNEGSFGERFTIGSDCSSSSAFNGKISNIPLVEGSSPSISSNDLAEGLMVE